MVIVFAIAIFHFNITTKNSPGKWTAFFNSGIYLNGWETRVRNFPFTRILGLRICWLRTKRLNIFRMYRQFLFQFTTCVLQLLYRSSEYKNAKERAQPELISVKQPIVSTNRLKTPLGTGMTRNRAVFAINYGTFTMMVVMVSAV